MSHKMLFGRNLDEYANDDIDELLGKLTEDEIRELGDEVDPDNSLLPPSQRSKDQTTKEPTGPFDRKKLIKFLIAKAKSEKDWDESVPFEKKVRGTIFKVKNLPGQAAQDELSSMGFDVEFDTEISNIIENASEDELVDLAAVLGFTGMMNQTQYHASQADEKLDAAGGFQGIAKSERTKAFPDEAPNATDVEESIKKLESNDPDLTVLNLNNIKFENPDDVVPRLWQALKANTHLRALHMSATGLTNTLVEPLFDILKSNSSIHVLNLSSNLFSGETLVKLADAINSEQSAVTSIHLANQRQRILGINFEQQLTKLIMPNPRLICIGLDFETAHARSQLREHLTANCDRQTRQLRRNKD